MKVRRFILISLVPIFVGLAVANAAALWFAKDRELTTDLEEQARSAAVSTGEYLAARPGLAERLATREGSSALTLSMAQIEGLKGIYLLDSQGHCCVMHAGRKPEHLPARPAVAMTPQLGAIEQLSTREHALTATMRLPSGEVLAIDLDADRLLVAREALRRQVLAMLAIGLIAGLLVAALVARWLVGDLRRLQRLLASEKETGADLAPRFMEIHDTAEAILLLQDNLRTGAALRKRRLLTAGDANDRTAAIRSRASEQIGERTVELHGIELAIGTIGRAEPGDAVAIIESTKFAAGVLIRVNDPVAAQAFATAALVRARLERFESQETFADDLELISGLFCVDLLAVAWKPGQATATVIEAKAGVCQCRTVPLPQGEAPLFYFGSNDAVRDERFDQLGWASALDRLNAARNLSEALGSAMSLVPTKTAITNIAA